MIALGSISTLIASHGLWLLAPIAVLEGPIVTVIAAWLASQGILNLWAVIAIVTAADLVGDVGLYALGRWGLGRMPARLRIRLGLTDERLASAAAHFEGRGGRTLLFGKITHSAGFAVLIAAGIARMPVARFFWFNLLGTVPKSLAFVALGYAVGQSYASIDGWITKGTLIMGAVLIAGGIGFFLHRKART